MAALVRLVRGPRHASAYECSLENFLFFALARFPLGNLEHSFVPTSYLAVIFSVSGLLLSTENWILREMSISVGAMPGSTVFLRQYFGGHGRIAHIFYDAADSNPEVLLSLLLQNGEACPVDASGYSFALRSSHLENWTLLPRASRG